MHITTDYLLMGAGATGLAFADSLAAESDADLVLVDRRPAPGGHWVDTYPFVALHSPSAYYGVNSLALGSDRIDEGGPNAGFYERASGSEVLDYYVRVASALEDSGRVRVLLGHELLASQNGAHLVRDLSTGDVHEVGVRRKAVDAAYLESSVPATHTPSFEVAADAPFIPVGGLPAAAGQATSYVVLGAGKTAVDACLWLLDNGVDPDRIQWVRARDAWFLDRAGFQPLEQVVGVMEGLAADAEAGARRGLRRPAGQARGRRPAAAAGPRCPGVDVPGRDAQRPRACRAASGPPRRAPGTVAPGRARPDRPGSRGSEDRS